MMRLDIQVGVQVYSRIRRLGERGEEERRGGRGRGRRRWEGTWRGETRETGGGREGQTCYHSTIYANYILTKMRGCAALPLTPKIAQRRGTIWMWRRRRFCLSSSFCVYDDKNKMNARKKGR